MKNDVVRIYIYGAEQNCASCVNAPSSKDTFEWIEAVLQRKFPENRISLSYIDIFKEQKKEEHALFAKRVKEEDLFYPVIVIEGNIISEGVPHIKVLMKELEQYGYYVEL